MNLLNPYQKTVEGLSIACSMAWHSNSRKKHDHSNGANPGGPPLPLNMPTEAPQRQSNRTGTALHCADRSAVCAVMLGCLGPLKITIPALTGPVPIPVGQQTNTLLSSHILPNNPFVQQAACNTAPVAPCRSSSTVSTHPGSTGADTQHVASSHTACRMHTHTSSV